MGRRFRIGFEFYLLTLCHETNVRGVAIIIEHVVEEPLSGGWLVNSHGCNLLISSLELLLDESHSCPI
jgi:hypothetical protein